MCSGSEADSYLRRIDFVYHSTLGLRVTKKKKGVTEHHTAESDFLNDPLLSSLLLSSLELSDT